MPLKTGKSDDDISANIKRLMHEGHPQEQAIAIAYKEAGRSNQDAARHVMDSASLASWLDGVDAAELNRGSQKENR
jgi:hypothetical protein